MYWIESIEAERKQKRAGKLDAKRSEAASVGGSERERGGLNWMG